jgi:hypothetical protein
LGDVFLGTGLDLNAAGRDIGQATDAADGWTRNVLPWQLESANQRGNTAFALGDALTMAAQLAAMRGMRPTGGTGTAGVPMTNSGTFAGGPAGLPGINGTANMPTSGSQWDFMGGWDEYAKQFGAQLGRGF